MADNKPQGQFLKIANTVTLVLLLGMTGLLAVQSWRLRQELASHQEPATAPPPPAGLTPAEVAPLPAPKKPPADAPVPKKAVTTNRNYTQPEAKPASPVAAPVNAQPDTLPAPAGRVVPTDVIPAQPTPAPPTEPPAPDRPEQLTATLASGTVLTVRLLDTLSTDHTQAGDRFRASLEEPIIVDGNVVVPRGTTVEGRIVEAQPAGRVKGVAEMTLELSQLRLSNGETVVLYSNDVRREGEASVGEDTATIGAGAAIGAAIGAITGGRKGAAVGAATGAGASTAGVLLSRGKPLVLGPETILSFQLNAPVTITYPAGQEAETHALAPERRSSAWEDRQRRRPMRRRW